MSKKDDLIDNETGEIVEHVGGEAAALSLGLARAEIDQQIATAWARPRSPQRVKATIISYATLDEEFRV